MHGRAPRLSVRARLTFAATGTIALLLSGAALLLVWQVHSSLLRALDATVQREALTIAAGAPNSQSPRIPTTANQNTVAQVIDTAHQVTASTADIDGEGPIFSFPVAPAGAPPTVRTLPAPPLGGGAYRVAGVATAGRTSYEVYVGRSLDDVNRSTTKLAAAVAVGVPTLVLVLALLTWGFAGRALRPVERLRRQAESITITDLQLRVDVPPGSDEIARLANTLNDLLRRLDVAVTRQREFVADAAHELRTPVAALVAELEVAQRTGVDSHPDVLLTDGRRLSQLIDDLLALARLDERRAPRPHDIDLDDIVATEVAALRRMTPLSINTQGVRAARIDGDGALLGRAVRNLLENASHHAKALITVTVDRTDYNAVLVVADDGPGIPLAERGRVFERFTRLQSSRSRDTGGTGLGLAIVREIVIAHGGSVQVDDNQPGARFVVTLPAHTGAAPEAPSRVTARAAATS
ncbi:MAG: signal transduction histidine kinase [Frankiales bacterium]|nr:signal transduction histidine kinase [Frankiales bacterium]